MYAAASLSLCAGLNLALLYTKKKQTKTNENA